ncbi:ribosomal protein S6 kinase-like 1 isoform X5 [Gallus gallus]|uniref:ribosomal protein S6 kinase-like 1 isoform X5 n=1 Tax=Gallus gallus TaxID=9031 RepID=UPI001F019E40|nr:ribosomal protein S6 kinase-like 1 isoform X5 [Gallus gallus]
MGGRGRRRARSCRAPIPRRPRAAPAGRGGGQEDARAPRRGPAPPGPMSRPGRDYLVEAARQLRLALERDVSEDYEEAFNHYQNGVDVLLRGVQGAGRGGGGGAAGSGGGPGGAAAPSRRPPPSVEPNRERREAVKRKITQYLRRAEEIFTCHLQRALGDGSPGGTGYSSLRLRPVRTLRSAVDNLRRCRVLALIDKVQVVQDPATGRTFVLKSLPKSFVETRERQTIIPHGVPFMVKLLCYYASEDSIFLHLEHVQGETLWSHLRAKYRTQQGASPSSASPCTTAPPVLRGHGGENSEDGAQGSSQGSTDQTASTPSPGLCEQGLVFHTQDCVTAAEAKDCMLARAASQHEPRALSGQTDSLTRGRAPAPSGLLRAPASWGHGRTAWAVKEEQVQLWAAEILLALEGLHQQGVLCRDLNPRNLLLDTAGHVRLTFFGQWTEVEPQCCSQALEQLYSAPEVGGIAELTEAADCWSFGSLLYELLTGVPLFQSHPAGIYPHTQLLLPEGLSLAATSLLTQLLSCVSVQLLQHNPKRRLGAGGGGIAKLKSHSFFSTVPWSKLVG